MTSVLSDANILAVKTVKSHRIRRDIVLDIFKLKANSIRRYIFLLNICLWSFWPTGCWNRNTPLWLHTGAEWQKGLSVVLLPV